MDFETDDGGDDRSHSSCVTTCLCLSLNNSARSRSILIAVDIKIDTEDKINPEALLAW